MLKAAEGGLCMLEVLDVLEEPEMIRRVLLCLMEVFDVLDVPEEMRSVLLCMLEVLEALEVLEVPEGIRCVQALEAAASSRSGSKLWRS